MKLHGAESAERLGCAAILGENLGAVGAGLSLGKLLGEIGGSVGIGRSLNRSGADAGDDVDGLSLGRLGGFLEADNLGGGGVALGDGLLVGALGLGELGGQVGNLRVGLCKLAGDGGELGLKLAVAVGERLLAGDAGLHVCKPFPDLVPDLSDGRGNRHAPDCVSTGSKRAAPVVDRGGSRNERKPNA